MGFFIFKLNSDKTAEVQKSAELQSQITSLNNTLINSQEKNNEKNLEEFNTISNNKNIISIGTERNTVKSYSNNNDNHFQDDETTGIGYYELLGNYNGLDYICFDYDNNNIIRDITIFDRET